MIILQFDITSQDNVFAVFEMSNMLCISQCESPGGPPGATQGILTDNLEPTQGTLTVYIFYTQGILTRVNAT